MLQFSEYTAVGFYTNLVESDDPNVLWQAAVDTLYRFAVSGFIWSPSLCESDSIVEFVERLAKTFPYPPGDIAPDWANVDIHSTERCSEIIWAETVDPRSWIPTARSSEVVERTFSSFGVSYDVYPVITVTASQ